MKAPMLAVGDGALGFWAAVREVWPETREQRCWVHKLANVLDKLPKRQSATPAAPQRNAATPRSHLLTMSRQPMVAATTSATNAAAAHSCCDWHPSSNRHFH